MAVTDDGFAEIGRALRRVSGESPVVATLEGGYDLKALQRSICAFLSGLRGSVPS